MVPEQQPDSSPQPELLLETSETTVRIVFRGMWTMDTTTAFSRHLREQLSRAEHAMKARSTQPSSTKILPGDFSPAIELSRVLPSQTPPSSPVQVSTQGTPCLELTTDSLAAWDSSLLVPTTRLVALARTLSFSINAEGLPAGLRNLITLALAVPPRNTDTTPSPRTPFLERVGDISLRLLHSCTDVLSFIGEVVLSFGRFFRGKSACTAGNIWNSLQETSASALPIVSLISLLVGLILAFVGVIQLRMFGAEIYVSSLVAVGMTRIMGAIMTGIILAGRTGAAYAAVIGTMQVNEEIDALTTLGVAPSDYLVLPRVIALTLMMPLLVVYSDVMGILGGFLVAVGAIGLDPIEYLTFTQKGFGLANVWVGMIHGAVFGLVISLTGCYQGLRCGRNAEAVGQATTAAVVCSIVGIVLSTAVLTLLFNILKI